jgi:preprotein translocase subunit SecY
MVSAAEQLALAKAKQLKRRIWLTLGALLVYQLGTFIPLPGVDPAAWDLFFQTNAGRASIMFE